MTHEQFIKPKTAKLAKQAGFDWKVYTRYFRDEFREEDVCMNYNNLDWFGRLSYSAPTQAVLQRWLREVKGVYIEITHTATDEFYVTIHSRNFIVTKHVLTENRQTLTFPTFEAALEAGEQKCLTLIIENQ